MYKGRKIKLCNTDLISPTNISSLNNITMTCKPYTINNKLTTETGICKCAQVSSDECGLKNQGKDM